MREEMCGDQYADNRFFLESGRAEARRVVSKLGYRKNMRVVEIGSGVGRLATGLLREVGDVEYWGFDPVPAWIDWCEKYIEGVHPSFRFMHIDVENENYNPDGAIMGEEFKFPLPDGHADIVYMWGVLTNMRLKDARNYISEISRLVRDGGRGFLTAFVEEDVPEETINPVDYVPYPCTVPLHVVRYEKEALFSIFDANGLAVEEFAHHGGSHPKQSEIYLRKVGSS
jgi:SAM-dependent methyltransferase